MNKIMVFLYNKPIASFNLNVTNGTEFSKFILNIPHFRASPNWSYINLRIFIPH